VKVYSHPAQVSQIKKKRKRKEFSLSNSRKLQKDLLLTQVSSEDQAKPHLLRLPYSYYFYFI
jgi:hypothetical protein